MFHDARTPRTGEDKMFLSVLRDRVLPTTMIY
jgi:hypothetical protein